MQHLSRSVILLVVVLAIFVNIERLDVNKENIVDIQTFVYVLGTIAVISIILLPALQRLHILMSLLGWLGIYLLGKLFFFYQHPFLGGVYTYLTITEVTFLVVLIWLTHHLAGHLREFEDTVEHMTRGNVEGRVRSLNEAAEDIQIEMFRSRHYQHPLSIIVIEPKPEYLQVVLRQAIKEVQKAALNSYVITRLADALSRNLRRTDIVLEAREKGHFVILCPDTNERDLGALVEYIEDTAAELMGVSVKCGMATFPGEGLTFEELVNQAEAKLRV